MLLKYLNIVQKTVDTRISSASRRNRSSKVVCPQSLSLLMLKPELCQISGTSSTSSHIRKIRTFVSKRNDFPRVMQHKNYLLNFSNSRFIGKVPAILHIDRTQKDRINLDATQRKSSLDAVQNKIAI